MASEKKEHAEVTILNIIRMGGGHRDPYLSWEAKQEKRLTQDGSRI